MQDDTGLKRIFTLSWAYALFQKLVGGEPAVQWVNDNFWRSKTGQKIVDIGCGPGNTVHHLSPGVSYVGFDISDEYIRHAQVKFANDPSKTFLVGVAEDFVVNLPEAMQGADLVIMNGLLHHLDDNEALTALRLAKKALAPHGRLICLEGCFLLRQAPMAHWLLSKDRGQNVRTETEWKALTAQVFSEFETHILTGLLRIPYTHIVIEAHL